MPRRIRLVERDGRWEARDLNVDVSAVGETRDEALDQLDDVVAAVRGDGGHEPSDEELRAAGVDPEMNRALAELRLAELRSETVYADAAPDDFEQLNAGASGDRTLDEIFDTEDSDED